MDLALRSTNKLKTPSMRRVRWVDLAVAVGFAIALALLHLGVAGPIPSGGDGGNWLALAHDSLGLDVVTPGVSYPPVFVLLLAGWVLLLDPVPALVVASLVARLASVLAVYYVMKDSGRVTSLMTAVFSALAAFQLEAYAWGAYPQILGTAFGILATYSAVRYMTDRRGVDAFLAIAATLAAALTHTLVGGVLIFAIVVATCHAGWVSARLRENWRGNLLFVSLLILLCGIPLLLGVVGGEGRAVMNPSELSFDEALRLAFGESPLSWLVLSGIGLLSLVHRRWPANTFLSVSVGAGWAIVGFGVFVVTGERRSLLFAQIGILLMAATELARWWYRVRGAQDASRAGSLRRLRIPLLMLIAALMGSVAVPGIAKYRQSTDFYRVVDESEIEALEFLAKTANEGDTVVATRGRSTIPIGWWVEGAAKLPTISGHDPSFLTFPSEIEEAEEANALFEGELSRSDAVAYLESVDARYLVVDRRGPDGGWMFRANRPSFDVIYDSPTLVIFEVRGQ
jgi:hypothetical protein